VAPGTEVLVATPGPSKPDGRCARRRLSDTRHRTAGQAGRDPVRGGRRAPVPAAEATPQTPPGADGLAVPDGSAGRSPADAARPDPDRPASWWSGPRGTSAASLGSPASGPPPEPPGLPADGPARSVAGSWRAPPASPSHAARRTGRAAASAAPGSCGHGTRGRHSLRLPSRPTASCPDGAAASPTPGDDRCSPGPLPPVAACGRRPRERRRSASAGPPRLPLLPPAIPPGQGEVGEPGTEYTSDNVAKTIVECSTSIPRAQLRPGDGTGCLGAPRTRRKPGDGTSERERGGRHGTSSIAHDQGVGRERLG
jgi:hypothetical protein